MELYQIRSFLRVAEVGSLTRAAAELYITQPAITQHVRALERELGALLFERTSRGMRLTPAGEAFLRYGRQCLGLLDECRQEMADLGSGAAGRLVLGVGTTTSIFLLPPWLQTFRQINPEVDVVVRTGGSRETAARVSQREVDLGLVTSAVQDPELTVVPLFEEEILLLAPAGHPSAAGGIPVAELVRLPLILFPGGSGFRAYLDHVLDAAGVTLQVKMESDSAEAIKSFVAVGLGASFLPASAVRKELDEGVLARIEVAGLPPLRRTTAAVHRKRGYVNRAAEAFLRLLKEHSGLEHG